MQNYHNGTIWPWFSFLFVKAAEARGHVARDRRPLERLMVRDDNVIEVYEQDGSLLETCFFRTERDFSGACGTYLFATAPPCTELERGIPAAPASPLEEPYPVDAVR